jgi:tRNA pseudouridine38-40 synthase
MNHPTTGPGRLALRIEYDGSAFHGWQAQADPRLPTVQESLEVALASVADHPVRVHCAGRTDTGVHATGQVVHFETSSSRPLKAWIQGVNSLLGSRVAVRDAVQVPDDFHARFSALSRRYRYSICNRAVRPAINASFLTHCHLPLDVQAMHEAGQLLLGERDFTSFRGAACQSSTPMRNVMELAVTRQGEEVFMDIEANAFLLHMVRNIAGVLILIGEGRQAPAWAGAVLAARDRTLAATTAPPNGLCLVAVRYPDHFRLPWMGSGSK